MSSILKTGTSKNQTLTLEQNEENSVEDRARNQQEAKIHALAHSALLKNSAEKEQQNSTKIQNKLTNASGRAIYVDSSKGEKVSDLKKALKTKYSNENDICVIVADSGEELSDDVTVEGLNKFENSHVFFISNESAASFQASIKDTGSTTSKLFIGEFQKINIKKIKNKKLKDKIIVAYKKPRNKNDSFEPGNDLWYLVIQDKPTSTSPAQMDNTNQGTTQMTLRSLVNNLQPKNTIIAKTLIHFIAFTIFIALTIPFLILSSFSEDFHFYRQGIFGW